MINKDKIITLLNSARNSIDVLNKYKLYPENDILDNQERLGNIKYNFIVLIESCIDICNYLSAKEFKIIPETYSKCFAILKEKNFLDTETAEKMSDFAKFRNLLVHLYWKVDDKIVVDKLKELHFIEKFTKTITQQLRTKN